MSFSLTEILELVGRLDDSPGDDTPRERFRQFLRKNVLDAGTLRDYVEECLRNKGDNYNRALQDLVNYAGYLLGFEIVFGRYQGVTNEIGFDGHWKSSTGFHVVAEVKTSEAFAISTSPLLGYADALIDKGEIPDSKCVMGLYVVGRPDPKMRQLEDAIVAQGRLHQLRIISVDSLLSLAELMAGFDIEHEEILAVLRPSGPRVDPIVEIMAAMVAEPRKEEEQDTVAEERPEAGALEPVEDTATNVAYWLTPIRSEPEESAEEGIRKLVQQERVYGFGDRTPGRTQIKPGDRICFSISRGVGVAAHAEVASLPENKQHPKVDSLPLKH